MKSVLFILAFSLILGTQAIRIYNVTAQRYSAKPIIANISGVGYKYNYNAAAYYYENNIELLVRVQNLLNQSDPYSVGPSYLSPSTITFSKTGAPSASHPIHLAHVNNNTTEVCGSEDPRVTYHNGLYYIFYTAYNCTNAMLSMSTATDPADPETWIDYGYVFPEKNWSKSAAALFATKENNLTQHYLFWGDSSYPQGGIGIATSNDGYHWNDTGNYLLRVRNNFFDSELVESGPSPLRLSTGDYLFIYNSARKGYPSVKPGWDLQYNLGFAILSGSNPLNVIQRSIVPLMSPVLDWEIGNNTNFLTPNVVFLEGLVRDPNGCPPNTDCFFGVYGGADSDVGAVRITVTWTGNVEDEEPVQSEENEYITI